VAAGDPEAAAGADDGAREEDGAGLAVAGPAAGLAVLAVAPGCAALPCCALAAAWAGAGKTAASPATPSALATPAAAVTAATILLPRRLAAWAPVMGSFTLPACPVSMEARCPQSRRTL
jgi:hypothetical protein